MRGIFFMKNIETKILREVKISSHKSGTEWNVIILNNILFRNEKFLISFLTDF